MSLAAAFVLAVQPLPAAGSEAAPIPRGVTVRTIASAEVLRVGRVGVGAGPDDVVSQRRTTADGRVLTEFR